MVSIEAHQFHSYEKINDEPTQVEAKKEVTAWSLKWNILAGLAVVAAVAVVAAYAASVVFTAGATAAAAPFIVAGLTSIVGTTYVMNQAEKDIESQDKSSAWTYMWEGFKGACQGADYGFTVCSVLSLGEAALTCLKGIAISGTPGLALAEGGLIGAGIAISLEIDAELVGALVLEGVAGLGLSMVLAMASKLGGAYRDTKGRGGEGHHCPSSQASDLPKNDGPSIHMEPEDHMKTSSWGRKKLTRF